MTYNQLIAYIDGLNADGSLSPQDYQAIVNYILAGGDIENAPRDLIQVRRGNSEDLPELAQGEFGYALDTKQLYIGGLNGNVRVTKETVVNVKDFGAVGDGVTNDTQAFLQALASGAKKLYVPVGTYLANIDLPSSSVTIEGEETNNTVIIGFDPLRPTLKSYGYLYPTLKNITFKSLFESIKPILDLTDSRYVTLENVFVFQLPNAVGAFSYGSTGIHIVHQNNSFTGYNHFSNVKANQCKYGLYGGEGLISASSIRDSVFAFNGYFGVKLVGAGVCALDNVDIDDNGKLASVEGFDNTKHGGIYIDGLNVTISNLWVEDNAAYPELLNRNDIYITPASKNINTYSKRANRGLKGNASYPEAIGNNENISIAEMVQNDGLGKERTRNIVENGLMSIYNGVISAWSYVNGSADTTISDSMDAPKGYEKSLKFSNNSAGGVKGLRQNIFPTLGTIGRYAGKSITCSFWVKLLSNTGSVRAGFTIDSNYFFSNGDFAVVTELNKWVKVVVTSVVPESGQLGIGFRNSGNGVVGDNELLIAGFSCSMSPRVNDSEGQTVTEYGGNIISQDFKIGGKRHGYAASIPTSGTWTRGDLVYNTAPAAGGYVGWTCTADGTPGTWKGFGLIQA